MDLEEIRSRHEAALLALPHVVGCGLGTRRVRGVDTGQPCVTVLVERKLPLPSLAPHEVIPPALQGAPTDVVEAGEVVALGTAAPPSPVLAPGVEAHRALHRPLVGGVSCGPTNFTLSGTVGLPLVYQGDVPCLLSSTHVIAPYWHNQGMDPGWLQKYGIKKGAPVRQPSLGDGGTEGDYVARLLEWAEISPTSPNDMDAALARLTVEARPHLLGLGEYREAASCELGMEVTKSGRTSGVTRGRVAYLDLAVRVGYPFGPALFRGQVGLEPALLRPGDSGSAMVAGDRAAALGFAGSRSLSIATPFKRVLERFGLSLMPPGTPVEQALASILDRVRVVWGFDNRRKVWSLYDPGAPQASTLRTLRDGEGYWIELAGDARLSCGGRERPLYQGWNLIGWREGN